MNAKAFFIVFEGLSFGGKKKKTDKKSFNFILSILYYLKYGIQCIRGCEIEGMLDEEGHVIEDGILHLYIWQVLECSFCKSSDRCSEIFAGKV